MARARTTEREPPGGPAAPSRSKGRTPFRDATLRRRSCVLNRYTTDEARFGCGHVGQGWRAKRDCQPHACRCHSARAQAGMRSWRTSAVRASSTSRSRSLGSPSLCGQNVGVASFGTPVEDCTGMSSDSTSIYRATPREPNSWYSALARHRSVRRRGSACALRRRRCAGRQRKPASGGRAGSAPHRVRRVGAAGARGG
jgi:hypothetical protein